MALPIASTTSASCARAASAPIRTMAEAYKWFALATVQGDKESAKKRDDVAAHLDPAALAAAQQAVKSFVAEPQPQEAVTVHEPPGGWDQAAGAPAQTSRGQPGRWRSAPSRRENGEQARLIAQKRDRSARSSLRSHRPPAQSRCWIRKTRR